MTHTDTITKKRYTLREVQATASSTYGLLIQSLNANSRAPYGIFFEGQLVAEVKKLADAIAIFPALYRAIQEQLAEQAAAEATEVSAPASPLPTVGDTYQIGGTFLRCTQVGGRFATTWEVFDNSNPLGEISMGWDCFWQGTNGGKFATPQEAVTSLLEARSVALSP